MAAENSIQPEQGLSVEWLKSNEFTISLPEEKPFRIRIISILYHQIQGKGPFRLKTILEVISGIELRTLQRYRKETAGFTTNNPDHGKEKQNTNFEIMVCDRAGKSRAGFLYTLNQLTHLDYSKSPQAKTLLDISVVDSLRNQELEKPMVKVERTESQTEDAARSICQRFAMGLYTIVECCETNGTTYIEFLQWVYVNDIVRQMFREANAMAVFANQSRQVTLVDNAIFAALQRGHTESSVTTYIKKVTPDHPLGIMVESGKKIIKKQFSPVELATLKALYARTSLTDDLVPVEEFAGWSAEQLDEYISDQSAKLIEARRAQDDSEE